MMRLFLLGWMRQKRFGFSGEPTAKSAIRSFMISTISFFRAFLPLKLKLYLAVYTSPRWAFR